MSRQSLSILLPLTVNAGIAALMLITGAAGVSAQPSETPPPLPPSNQDNAAPAPTRADQQQPAQQAAAPASNPAGNLPPIPLGHDGISEVQSQLIALGFDPGPVDGEAGPATLGAARQYNENRGGYGPVPIDGALLARLQQDTGPRLTPEQVAIRSQPRHPVANPLEAVLQQFGTTLRTLLSGGY